MAGAAPVMRGGPDEGAPPKRRSVLLVPEFDRAVDVLGEWIEDGDAYAVEGTDPVGAGGLRIAKGVVEPPPQRPARYQSAAGVGEEPQGGFRTAVRVRPASR